MKDAEKSELEESPNPKLSYMEGVVHMFRATVGTGLLALPSAFRHAGYIGGTIGTVFVVIIATYCYTILAECQRELKKRNKNMVPTYQGTVHEAFLQGPNSFKKFAGFFSACTNIFILMGQVAGIWVYIIFTASNIKAAAYPYLEVDQRYIILALTIPLIVLNMILSLKSLAVVSSFGSSVLILSCGVVMFYILRDPVSFHGRQPFGSLLLLPKFFGTVFFAIGAVSAVLPVKNEMKSQDEFFGSFGVIRLSAYFYGLIYAGFGTLGYLKYGDEALGSITLNLPKGEILVQVVQMLLALSMLSATSLQNYVGVVVIWDDYLSKRVHKHRHFARCILSISVVLFTLILTLLVPNLETVLAVSGVLGQCTVGSTLPCLVHFLTYHDQPSFWEYARKFWVDVVVLIFSTMVLIAGLAF